jgi:hypothetical protein
MICEIVKYYVSNTLVAIEIILKMLWKEHMQFPYNIAEHCIIISVQNFLKIGNYRKCPNVWLSTLSNTKSLVGSLSLPRTFCQRLIA